MPIDSAASGADASLLFQALQLGELELANRIVMAPMTRNRADAEGVPGEIMVEHYAARAEAGLIVAEGTWPCAEGQGYCRQPGIVTDAQVAGWRKVVEAVHAKGGRIVLQIMHAGRIGSVHIKPAGVETLAPSGSRSSSELNRRSSSITTIGPAKRALIRSSSIEPTRRTSDRRVGTTHSPCRLSDPITPRSSTRSVDR